MMERGSLDVKLKWKRSVDGVEEGFKLIGKVVSKTRMGIGTVRDSVSAAWKVEGEWDVKMIGFNLFTFTFKIEGEADRILKENPWIVRNYMLSLQKRKPYLSDNEIQINTCDFWVQFHNLPPEGRIVSNIELMAKLVGRLIEVENPEEKRFVNRSFGRARVELDIDRPLVPGFSAPRPDKSLDDVWIQIKHEKLVRFCYNCGKLGHESKGCEEEAVEFTVNGSPKGYDASLCTQAFRQPVPAKEGWNQGKQATTCLVHGESKNNKCWYGGPGMMRRNKEEGIRVEGSRASLGKESNQVDGGLGTDEVAVERSTWKGKEREDGTHGSYNIGLGQSWMTQRKNEPNLCNLGWGTNEVNGINSLLRARREKLMKTQSKYWVELVDEDEDGAHESGAIIPVQNTVVGELAQSIRYFSLKRKHNEGEESLRPKRRKDHLQESPRSAGEREKVNSELQVIARTDGSSKFNYNYEGDLCFRMGKKSKETSKIRKKTKRVLFSNANSDYQLVVNAEAFNYDREAFLECGLETVEEREGCGGWPETATQGP